MPDIFSYSFMIRAFIAGGIIALTIPLLGNFLVARRYSLISDSLAHVSLAGVGAGLLFGVAPVTLAIPVTIAGALLLEWLRTKRRLSGEISLAILMSSGLAVAVVLANLAQNSSVDFSSYLFGSITTTTTADIVTLAIAGAFTVMCLLVKYRAFVHIAYDEDSARIAGHNVTFLNYLLTALTAVMVVLSLRIVGGLLMSALMVIPVVAASHIARSFFRTVVFSVAFGMIAVALGLTVAFYAGIAAGGAIVLAALTILVGCMLWERTAN